MDYGVPNHRSRVNGHGDIGPHNTDCHLCLSGVEHQHKLVPITRSTFRDKIFSYYIQALRERLAIMDEQK